ncbi:hypothetical protein VTH06DRAFT_2328 [Thermothelomyces fergusii]
MGTRGENTLHFRSNPCRRSPIESLIQKLDMIKKCGRVKVNYHDDDLLTQGHKDEAQTEARVHAPDVGIIFDKVAQLVDPDMADINDRSENDDETAGHAVETDGGASLAAWAPSDEMAEKQENESADDGGGEDDENNNDDAADTAMADEEPVTANRSEADGDDYDDDGAISDVFAASGGGGSGGGGGGGAPRNPKFAAFAQTPAFEGKPKHLEKLAGEVARGKGPDLLCVQRLQVRWLLLARLPAG